MSDVQSNLIILLVGPGTMLLFGIGFLWAWTIERSRRYLLMLATGCFLFVAAVLIQTLYWPADMSGNAVLSHLLYVGSVLAVAEGLQGRAGKSFGARANILLAIAAIAPVLYYTFAEPDLLVRTYIQNFGFGIVFLAVTYRLRHLALGAGMDRVLFWLLLVFAVQFFPRTIFTIGIDTPQDHVNFSRSLFWYSLQFSIAVLGAGLSLVMLAVAVSDTIEGLRQERDLDRLTGILNRRGFEERATAEIDRASGELALVICDIDFFKRINDRFGHPTGDAVLQMFGRLLREGARQSDIVGRIGGEEFAMVLPNTGVAGAREVVSRLQRGFAAAQPPVPDAAVKITASFGVAVRRSGEDLDQLIKRADAALYRAKEADRNQVVFSVLDSEAVQDEAGTWPPCVNEPHNRRAGDSA